MQRISNLMHPLPKVNLFLEGVLQITIHTYCMYENAWMHFKTKGHVTRHVNFNLLVFMTKIGKGCPIENIYSKPMSVY
jgi:hypothetical protein